MLVLSVIAATLAAATAFQPGPRPACDLKNTMAGTNLLPHENFCNMFYTCDLKNNQTALQCPDEMLFAYGPGHAVCVRMGYANSTCPNWQCDSAANIGNKFPSPCCDEYWECTGIKKFERRVCNSGLGEKFDPVNEVCSNTYVCLNDEQKVCPKKFVAGGVGVCPHSPGATPCEYKTVGWPKDRKCPGGTKFNQQKCGCGDHDLGCAPSGLSAEQQLIHKAPQANGACQATGRMQWNANSVSEPITVFSNRLSEKVDHFFLRPSSGFSINSNGQEALFSYSSLTQADNVADNFIYDYFYNDNVLYAPTAFRMTVKFSSATFQNAVLLENRYDSSASNTYCNPSLRILASAGSINLGQIPFTFTVSMRGENGIQSLMQAQVNGQVSDYFRLTIYFGSNNLNAGNTQSGTVVNRGSTNLLNGNQAQFAGDNRNLGASLARVKCGFAFCRKFTGALRDFAVYEGCSSINNVN